MSGTEQKLQDLRAAMDKAGVEGFVVPKADEFHNEFPPPRAERLRWLTGFTGSGGAAIVLKDKAVVMTDGRYMIQVRQQVDGDLFETANFVKTPLGDWMKDNAAGPIGYDPMLHSAGQIEKWEKQGVTLKPVANLIDEIWTDQPEPPMAPVTVFSEDIAGKSSIAKRQEVAESMDVDAAVITLPDSIAWLLNVRGGDVDYAPLILSYAILYQDGRVDWFVEAEKITADVTAHLGDRVSVCAPDELPRALAALKGKKVGLDNRTAPVWFKTKLEGTGAKLQDKKDPCILPKACKTEAEQASIKAAHIKDGIAIVKFLAWLGGADGIDELAVVEKLRGFREQDPDFLGDSFATISGFGPNGAIIHYRVTKDTNLPINPPGLLLVDSGGQYPGGTTDITRTIAAGEPTDEQRRNFTLVLKGHIALANAHFPEGTVGAQIDALARQPLWNEGLDFAHGTGHGVGCYLQVHEEAASISPKGQESFKPGMLISNEPGYYKEGEYGIRIESLVLVIEDGECADTGSKMMRFETVTLAPIDRNLMDVDVLSTAEKTWLNAYHKRVYDTLSPLLDERTELWLKTATAEI